MWPLLQVMTKLFPALDNPKAISAEAASYLDDKDEVFGVSLNGIAHAYPLRIMNWHEMLNAKDWVYGIIITGSAPPSPLRFLDILRIRGGVRYLKNMEAEWRLPSFRNDADSAPLSYFSMDAERRRSVPKAFPLRALLNTPI